MKLQFRPFPPLANARGVTYLLAMMAVVLIGISITVAGKQWKTMVQREKEADLLAHGIEIQMALAAYSATKKQGRPMPGEVYPLTLEELTKVTVDNMTGTPKRFLRKVYRDPITRGDWDYVPGETGGIKGVKSKSSVAALKQHGFPQQVQHFEGLVHYNEWIFQHPNTTSIQQSQASRPGVQMPPGTPPPTSGGPPGFPPGAPPAFPPGGSPGFPPGAPPSPPISVP